MNSYSKQVQQLSFVISYIIYVLSMILIGIALVTNYIAKIRRQADSLLAIRFIAGGV